MLVDLLHHEREDEQGEEGGADQTADDDRCQRPLALTADAVAQGGGHEAEGGHHGCHQHTADARVHATCHRIG